MTKEKIKEIVSELAEIAHKVFMLETDEALDGDQTKMIAQEFLLQLNKLNGNE